MRSYYLFAFDRPCQLDGSRVPPSELDTHRQTHHFRAPCCLCAVDIPGGYVESSIGLVRVLKPLPNTGFGKHPLNGQYVAKCRVGLCGYTGERLRIPTLRLS